MSCLRALLFATAVYAVTAALLFGLVNSPFAGRQQLPDAILNAIAAAAPYIVLLGLSALTVSSRLETVFDVVSALVILIGLLAYNAAFAPTDGEFGLVFYATPVLQGIFILPVLLSMVAQSRRLKGKKQ